MKREKERNFWPAPIDYSKRVLLLKQPVFRERVRGYGGRGFQTWRTRGVNVGIEISRWYRRGRNYGFTFRDLNSRRERASLLARESISPFISQPRWWESYFISRWDLFMAGASGEILPPFTGLAVVEIFERWNEKWRSPGRATRSSFTRRVVDKSDPLDKDRRLRPCSFASRRNSTPFLRPLSFNVRSLVKCSDCDREILLTERANFWKIVQLTPRVVCDDLDYFVDFTMVSEFFYVKLHDICHARREFLENSATFSQFYVYLNVTQAKRMISTS